MTLSPLAPNPEVCLLARRGRFWQAFKRCKLLRTSFNSRRISPFHRLDDLPLRPIDINNQTVTGDQLILGRAEELAAVTAELKLSSKSVIAMQASPGTGKTAFVDLLADHLFKNTEILPVPVTFNSAWEKEVPTQCYAKSLAARVLYFSFFVDDPDRNSKTSSAARSWYAFLKQIEPFLSSLKLERILQALLDLTGRRTVALMIDEIWNAALGMDELNDRVDLTLRAATEVADLTVGKWRVFVTSLDGRFERLDQSALRGTGRNVLWIPLPMLESQTMLDIFSFQALVERPGCRQQVFDSYL